MRLSNNWSDTLYVESARRKDMIVVATGGFELFLTCLQPSKRKFKMNQTIQKQFSQNTTHTKNLIQPKRVVSDLTVLSGQLYAVSLQTYLFRIERQWIPLGIETGMPQAH